MKTANGLLLIIAFLILHPGSGAAQSSRQDENVVQWRITEKEVVAVQTELSRRGHYKGRPTGVLDRETREALRAYQTESGLKVTGRIDRETYNRLELPYPATGRERDSQRRSGVLPKIGYGIKDKAVTTGQTVGGAAGKVKDKAKSGLEKTWDTGNSTVSKTKDVAQGAGEATVKGARTVGRGSQRAGNTLIGRSDAEIQLEVREVLESDRQTEKWQSEVKTGHVTIKTPPQHSADIGAVISNIRKVAGVKSVFVIAQ